MSRILCFISDSISPGHAGHAVDSFDRNGGRGRAVCGDIVGFYDSIGYGEPTCPGCRNRLDLDVSELRARGRVSNLARNCDHLGCYGGLCKIEHVLALRVGTVLYGYCGGHFGRDSYPDKRVEALGVDWLIAREEATGTVVTFTGDLRDLLEYTSKPVE